MDDHYLSKASPMGFFSWEYLSRFGMSFPCCCLFPSVTAQEDEFRRADEIFKIKLINKITLYNFENRANPKGLAHSY